MQLPDLPKIGLRTTKTALAVFYAYHFFQLSLFLLV